MSFLLLFFFCLSKCYVKKLPHRSGVKCHENWYWILHQNEYICVGENCTGVSAKKKRQREFMRNSRASERRWESVNPSKQLCFYRKLARLCQEDFHPINFELCISFPRSSLNPSVGAALRNRYEYMCWYRNVCIHSRNPRYNKNSLYYIRQKLPRHYLLVFTFAEHSEMVMKRLCYTNEL